MQTIVVPSRQVRIRPTGACPFCGGRAFDIDIPLTDRDRPHVSSRGTVACLLCGRTVAELVIGETLPRMTAAEFQALPKQQGERPNTPYGTNMQRLLDLLAERGPMYSHEIARTLDLSQSSVRNAVDFARKRGHDVAFSGGKYWMERGR